MPLILYNNEELQERGGGGSRNERGERRGGTARHQVDGELCIVPV